MPASIHTHDISPVQTGQRVSKRERDYDTAVITEFSLSSCRSTCPVCAEPCQKPHSHVLEPHPSLACVFKQSVHRTHYIKPQAAQTSEFEDSSSICPWITWDCVCVWSCLRSSGSLADLSWLLAWARFDPYTSPEHWEASACPPRLKPSKAPEHLGKRWTWCVRKECALVGPADACNKIRGWCDGWSRDLDVACLESRSS